MFVAAKWQRRQLRLRLRLWLRLFICLLCGCSVFHFSVRSASAVGQSVGPTVAASHFQCFACTRLERNAASSTAVVVVVVVAFAARSPSTGSSTNTTHTHQRKRERERLPNETRTQQTRFLLDFIVAVFVVAAELRTTQAESRRSRQNDTHTNKHTEHNIIITITTTKQSGAPLLFRCRRLVVSPRLTDEHVRFVRFVSIRFVLALERTERAEHERVCTACCHCRCRCRCPRRCHCGLTYWL